MCFQKTEKAWKHTKTKDWALSGIQDSKKRIRYTTRKTPRGRKNALSLYIRYLNYTWCDIKRRKIVVSIFFVDDVGERKKKVLL